MSKTRQILLMAIILVAVLSEAVSQDRGRSLLSLLPSAERIQSWSMMDTARIYVTGDLYLFIDGGADLFFEYGFQQAVAARYHNADGETINLEVYEMNDAGAAFGIYSVRAGEKLSPIAVGQEGSIHPYYVMFWKGRFYVSMAASDSTAKCRTGLVQLARAVDEKIIREGQEPEIVKLLPKENLINRRYFRGSLGLSSMRILDAEDVLQMGDGVVGTYGEHTIILLRYGSAAEAEKRLVDISSTLRSAKRVSGYRHRNQISRILDGRNRTVCFGRSGSCIIFSISPKGPVAVDSLEKAISQLRGL